jgi:hypothetical protein
VDQATQVTAPAASTPPRTGTFQHAHAIAGDIVTQLAQLPFAVEVEEDWPSGWRVHLKFREQRAAGLFAFASFVDVPVTRAQTTFGVHLDAIVRFETVEVRASALVSPAQAAELTGQAVSEPTPDASTSSVQQPVPLGDSVLARVQAVTPIVPVSVEPPADDEEDDDAARCVRCGCTEDASCVGGCSWVPNRMLIDLCSGCATDAEIAGVTHMIAVAEAVGGDQ